MEPPESRTRLTEAEYLALEEASEIRHEFVNGYMYAMTGATQAHETICLNIASFLHAYLRGKPCRAFASNMRVKLDAASNYYYPDVVVDCGPLHEKSTIANRPRLIVEVLSPRTSLTDRREKLAAYQQIPSLEEYLMVYQDRQQVELHRRNADGVWIYFVLNATHELILESLPEGPVPLPFASIYEELDPPKRVKECDEPEYDFV